MVKTRIPPLTNGVPIVNPTTGAPSPQFIQLWQQLFGNTDIALDDVEAVTAVVQALETSVQALETSVQALETRQIIAGVGLSGGGPLSSDVTLDLEDTTVSPGSYGNATNVPQVTIDQQGRVTNVVNVPISAGSSSAWTLAVSGTITGSPSQVDITTGLTGVTEFLLILRNSTRSISGTTSLRFSVDGGSTFFSTSGDYVDILTTGAEGNLNGIPLFTTASALARSGWARFTGVGTSASARFIEYNGSPGTALFTASTSAVNAIRLYPSAGGTLNAGTYLLFVR